MREAVLDIEEWVAGFVDIGDLHAVLSFLAALVTLWVMQCVTHDAGFRTTHQMWRTAQRLSLALLAVGLMANAGTPFVFERDPWLGDVLAAAALIVVLISTAAARHHSAAAA